MGCHKARSSQDWLHQLVTGSRTVSSDSVSPEALAVGASSQDSQGSHTPHMDLTMI